MHAVDNDSRRNDNAVSDALDVKLRALIVIITAL